MVAIYFSRCSEITNHIENKLQGHEIKLSKFEEILNNA